MRAVTDYCQIVTPKYSAERYTEKRIMELFLLCLDDLEDWICALALVGERIRRGLQRLGLLLFVAVLQVLAIFLTLREPALGAAIATLLTVAVLYRSATTSIGAAPQAA